MPFELASSGFGITAADLIDDSAEDESPRGKDMVLVFQTRKDRRVRPEHAALHGRVFELTDSHAPSPPLAYGCRCEMVLRPRAAAERQKSEDEVESLKKFPGLEKNIAEYYPEDVAAGFEAGDLVPEDLILAQTGDRISADMARVIISARVADTSINAGLRALAALADRGISGQTLRKIVATAKQGIANGATPVDAALAAFTTEQRGLVTAKTRAKAASELVATGLLR